MDADTLVEMWFTERIEAAKAAQANINQRHAQLKEKGTVYAKGLAILGVAHMNAANAYQHALDVWRGDAVEEECCTLQAVLYAGDVEEIGRQLKEIKGNAKKWRVDWGTVCVTIWDNGSGDSERDVYLEWEEDQGEPHLTHVPCSDYVLTLDANPTPCGMLAGQSGGEPAPEAEEEGDA